MDIFSNDIKLTDLVDVGFLQKLQDDCVLAMGVGCLIRDRFRIITKPTNSSDFCFKYTRTTEVGAKMCNDCGIDHCLKAAMLGKPLIYTCHNGLIDFSVPIMVNGKLIASFVGGQVLTEKPDEEQYRKKARELNINENEYIEALRKVKILNMEQIENATNLLFSISNVISDIAQKNYALLQQNERAKNAIKSEKVLRDIINSYIVSNDVKKIYNSILCKTTKLFNADRGIFVVQKEDLNSENVLSESLEYLSSPTIPSVYNNMPSQNIIKKIIGKLANHEVLYGDVNDPNKKLSSKGLKNVLSEDLEVKSYINAPIYFGEQNYGFLVLHYVRHSKSFTPTEIDLIKAIAGQAAAIIHQAKLNEAVKRSEEYIRTVINNINDAVITVDESFSIISCNEAVENVFGYTSEECLGQPISLLINHDFVGENKTFCVRKSSFVGRKKDGTLFDTELNIRFIDFENKTIILFVIRDITERKKVENMKNEFVATVSHELRTPLTSIRGALGLIMSGKLGEMPIKVKELLDIANNNCVRLINLINDILDIEKIEAGKMDFIFGITDIIPLVEKAIEFNISYAQKFNVKLNFIDEVSSAFVNIDNDRFIQVVTNLLSNAIKFSKPESPIDIKCEKASNMIKLSITNYGITISKEFQNRIFQKFAQADSSNSRQKGGTGLGLSISKAIIEKMGGNIDFVSQDGQTTFSFVLPEIKNDEKFITKQDNSSKLNVLVCEDDKDARFFAKAALQDKANVFCSKNLKETKKLLAEYNFDILLLDLELPDGNGLDLLEIMKTEKYKNIVIVILSAHKVSENVAKQVDSVLSKSKTSKEDLLNIINRIQARGKINV